MPTWSWRRRSPTDSAAPAEPPAHCVPTVVERVHPTVEGPASEERATSRRGDLAARRTASRRRLRLAAPARSTTVQGRRRREPPRSSGGSSHGREGPPRSSGGFTPTVVGRVHPAVVGRVHFHGRRASEERATSRRGDLAARRTASRRRLRLAAPARSTTVQGRRRREPPRSSGGSSHGREGPPRSSGGFTPTVVGRVHPAVVGRVHFHGRRASEERATSRRGDLAARRTASRRRLRLAAPARSTTVTGLGEPGVTSRSHEKRL